MQGIGWMVYVDEIKFTENDLSSESECTNKKPWCKHNIMMLSEEILNPLKHLIENKSSKLCFSSNI